MDPPDCTRNGEPSSPRSSRGRQVRVDSARLGEETAMYKHILIPTDGSALSEEAIRQGVAFAKSINATVTAVTVSPSFHTVSRDTMMVSDTREQYQKDCEDRAERYRSEEHTSELQSRL